MLTRRIAASACALALVAPAAAIAHPADNGPVVSRAGVVYGDSQYDQQNQQDLSGTVKTAPVTAVPGDTAAPGQQKYDLPTAADLTAAKAPKQSPVVASDNSSDGWQIAAIAEAGVLAALAVGSVALVRARRRSPLGA